MSLSLSIMRSCYVAEGSWSLKWGILMKEEDPG